MFSFIAGWILARKPSPGPSENTGWRRYIFIFSLFNQLDKYWPTLSLICSNLYFGGYAVVFRKQDDRVRRGVERGSGKVGSVGRGWQYYGVLAATAAKTSLIKWIGDFFFQTLSRLFQFAENFKCRQISLELISWGPHSSLERERKFRRRLFTSSIKYEIRHFHVVVVQ